MHERCEVRLRRRSERLFLLLLAATIASAITQPAFSQSANYFFGRQDEPGASPHGMMLGSAPSPKPADLCVAGSTADHCYTDATKTKRKIFVPDFDNPSPGHYREYRPGDEKLIADQIRAQKQVGREIFRLGGGNSVVVSPATP
jgi:hypothetical protein